MDSKTKISRIAWLLQNSFALYFGMLLIFAVFTFLCALRGIDFLTPTNISNIVVQSAITAVISIGASVVILSGGIDLSVGSVAAFVGMLMAFFVKSGIPIGFACVIGIMAGIIIGLINGLGISYAKIPALIMTLGMMSIARGGALAVNDGKPIANFPAELGLIANSTIFGIPIFVIYVLVFYAVMVMVMSKSKFGRHVYAIGGNEKAAVLSGVKVKSVSLAAYCIGGMFSAIGGVFLLSRLMYATPNAGSGYEMDAIASTVIGGIALSGGSGKLINTLVGALILSTLKAGLQMLNVPYSVQQMTTGLVIIIAVYFDKASERRAE